MTPEQLTWVKDWSIVLAGVVALVTFMAGFFQYRLQGRQGRAAQFVLMRRRFLEDPVFREILNLLAADSPNLKDIPIQDRRNLVGFLEEVALLVNSHSLRLDVAHAMYGYYFDLIDRSEHFWDGLDRDSMYWDIFRAFSRELRQRRKFDSKNLRI